MSFLVDFLRFEAARSSKVAILGLWIGPNSTLSWRESLWRVAKKKRQKSNKLAWFYYVHTPQSKYVFLSSGSCMNESVVFTDNIFRPLFIHFVGLSSPTHSLFIQEANYMTLYDPGWFNLSRTCHVAPSWIGYFDVIDLSFVIYVFMSP